MNIKETMLPEFDQEMANLRKTIERVPDDKFSFKPHPKSPDMGWMANHLANLVGWGALTLTTDSLDVAPVGGPPFKLVPVDNTKAVLEILDKNVAETRAALASAGDEQLMQPWSLLKGGQTTMTMPRATVLRIFMLNHVIHHRAQLTVYLRLNDVPVPALYGPSADEGTL